MNPRRKKRMTLALLVLIGLGLSITLVMYALRSNIDLFYTPSEILQGKGENHEMPEVGQRLRIGGMVMPGSVKRDDKTLEMSFKVYDARGAITVTYTGILPDLFREGQGIVAQGAFGADRTFHARQVLAKHDENYMPREVADRLKAKGEWRPEGAASPASTRGSTAL